MAEHIETILRLVAEGKLSAEDADPLLAALTGPASQSRPAAPSGAATPAAPRASTWTADDDTSECELEWTHTGPERDQLASVVISLS